MTNVITVLVVEDETSTRASIARHLEDEGFNVYEAGSSAVALATLYGNVGVQCMLTHVDLGQGMDGLELASAVRDQWPDIGVIVLSGRTLPSDVSVAEFSITPYDAGVGPSEPAFQI